MKQAVVFRLIWIDMWVENADFPLRLEHICLTHDISVPQASADLATFKKLFPGRITYDLSAKGYLRNGPSAFEKHEHTAIALACSYASAAGKRLGATALDGPIQPEGTR